MAEKEQGPQVSAQSQPAEGDITAVEENINLDLQKSPADLPDENAQDGVRKVEAVTLTWSRTSLTIVYICMWLVYFVRAFFSSVTGNLSAYVVSDFSEHSLIPVISIVSSVMGAACYMPIAKILDVWDRPLGFALMTGLGVIGTIMMATCHNVATYCAAEVFSTVGLTGMIYCVDVITADTSKMEHRGIAFAFTSSPYIITAFAGPKAAEGFYEANWRWAFGAFAIILPVVATPMVFILLRAQNLAKKKGLLIRESSGRTWWQSTIHYAIEFDLLGVVLLAAGLVLFLLPFSIASSTADDWRSGSIIAMLVVGAVLLVVFGLCERFVAPKPFVPYNILLSRTVIAVCLLDATYQIAYYCWNSYYTSYLQVVYNTSISSAGYISGIFDVVSGVWLFAVGFLIRWTGRFKWLFLWSVPLYMLGVGLMIYFRQPHVGIGYMVMCNIFMALAGGTMIICQQVTVMAVAEHNTVAAMLAILGVAGNIGGAVGNSISGAIWTHTLPGALQNLLPDAVKGDWESIYDSLDVQLSYPIGSDEREAIMYAYAATQKRMLIAGTAIMALALIWMLLIKDISVKNSKQVRGMLF